jgi:hypothetical protein
MKAITDRRAPDSQYRQVVAALTGNVVKLRDEVEKVFENEPDLLEDFDSIVVHMMEPPDVGEDRDLAEKDVASIGSGDRCTYRTKYRR